MVHHLFSASFAMEKKINKCLVLSLGTCDLYIKTLLHVPRYRHDHNLPVLDGCSNHRHSNQRREAGDAFKTEDMEERSRGRA